MGNHEITHFSASLAIISHHFFTNRLGGDYSHNTTTQDNIRQDETKQDETKQHPQQQQLQPTPLRRSSDQRLNHAQAFDFTRVSWVRQISSFGL